MNHLQRSAIVVAFAMANIMPSIAHADGELSLSWRLIGNRPAGGYQAELTLHNQGTEALSDDWKIYFNSASRLLPESVSPEYLLTHINGDFYALSPGKRFAPISPGESAVIAWEGTPWAINISDAPSGFYLVRGDRSKRVGKPVSLPLRIEPFPAAEKLQRGAADIEPVCTPASRYHENESLTLLPSETLIKVVPTPYEMQDGTGAARIHKSSVVVYEPELDAEANYLASSLEPLLGSKVSTERAGDKVQRSSDIIQLQIGDVKVGGATKYTGDEAYMLTVSADEGIKIVGVDATGVFYGLQSLRSLLPISSYRQPTAEIQVDAVKISDAPRFRYRGVHLDVARNFQRKETVEKLLDLMAFYKLNRLHLHLTDDEGWRLHIARLPELTQVGGRRGHTLNEHENLVPSYGSGPDATADKTSGNGYYTQADMVEILRYAAERHITVIPEIDLPGHSRAAIKAMEARYRRLSRPESEHSSESLQLREANDPSKYESVQMWRDNIVDIGREDTYRFVSMVVDELADIYERAGVPLSMIHLGGDEVPNGAWEKSPACKNIAVKTSSKITRRGQLELYFLNRASDLLAKNSIQPACWEDCLLMEADQDASAGDARKTAGKPTPTAYVWNNVWGWGREDAAYRLANAGFDVVLCNATHLYFDLACEKDPPEPGYYWAGFVDVRKPFEFVPLDVFQNADRNSMGQPVSAESLAGRTRLTEKGAQHVLGIQGQLWGENLRDSQTLEYMAFPRIIALAERAWAKSPPWTNIQQSAERRKELERDWNRFANQLGQRELPRLDWLFGGVHYRLPPPGALVRDGFVYANVAFPGVEVRYTLDDTEPDQTAPLYREPVRMRNSVKIKSFDTRGRSSRASVISSDSR